MLDKPFSAACEGNREPILAVLREHLSDRRRVLEIGSGTGQHAVHFAAGMPWLVWQSSDRFEHLAGIRAWLAEAALPNTPAPLELDVRGRWPQQRFDAVFSANTLHIMAWREVEAMFRGIDDVLEANGTVAIYGPFKYGGAFTSESNAAFDAALRAVGGHMGLRDAEAVHSLARRIGLQPIADIAMPANNRTLVWRRAH